MRKLGFLLVSMCALASFGQTSAPKFQSGTITSVSPHQNSPGDPASDVRRYDVSVKIGNILYVVLYTPANGANTVEYSPGVDMLFAVGANTLTFNSKLSGPTELPILRREVLPAEDTLDWSKARGQYFSMKQQHLSKVLGLTDDQQAKLKPLLERETAEAGEILWNPVLSRKDKLKRYAKVVSSSDARIKPFLSPTQVEKLLALRRQQKNELQKAILEPKADRDN